MRTFSTLALLSGLIATTTGCHSPYVAATVTNHTTEPLQLIEVDYPSASFGTENLASGSEFHYRFKVLGEGNLKLLYTDSMHRDHKVEGPLLREGTEGQLSITIGPSGVNWQSPPAPAK